MTYILIGLIVILFAVVSISKIVISRNLKKYFDERDFESYHKYLNSLLVKVYVRPFNIEMNRLMGYIADFDDKNTEKQLHYMLNKINLTKQQKGQVADKGFYLYLKKENFKKCKEMMALIDEMKTKPSDYNSIKTVCDIFCENKWNHIEELEDAIQELNEKSFNPKQKKLNTGIYEYMIAYQYQSKGDLNNTKKYLDSALGKCQGTPYEAKIKNMLANIKKKV